VRPPGWPRTDQHAKMIPLCSRGCIRLPSLPMRSRPPK